MSLLTHLLAADARRFRMAIGLWLAVVVAETAAQHLGTFVTPYTRHAEAVALAGWLFWMSGAFVSSALVPLIVHIHPAVGSDAFWMTRPIPPRTLAASKILLLAAVFVGVPLAVDQVAMAIYGVPVAEMVRVAAQTTVVRGLLLALLMAAAALTPNLALFALICGGVLFGVAMLVPLLTITLDLLRPDEPSLSVFVESGGNVLPFVPPGSFPTAPVVAAAVVVAGGIAAVVLQYQARRLRLSAAVLALSLAGVFLIASVWPSLAHVDRPAPEWAGAPQAVEVIAHTSDVRVEPSPLMPDAGARWGARVPVRMTHAAPGWLATARLQRASLELDSGSRFSMRSDGNTVLLDAPDGDVPLQRALQHTLDVPYVVNVTSARVRNHTVLALHLRGQDLRQMQPKAATFHGEFRVDLGRLDVASTMPVMRGEYQDGAYRFTVIQVRETPVGVILQSRVSGVSTFLDTGPRPAYSYFLRNRRRKEAVIGSASHHSAHLPLPFFGLSFAAGEATGFSVSAHSIAFSSVGDERAPEFEIDRKWLEEAELVIVRATYDGSVRRRLVLENFPVTPTRAGS